MAQINREQHDLPAIRIRQRIRRSEDTVLLEGFAGRTSLDSLEVPAHVLGLAEDGSSAAPQLRPEDLARVAEPVAHVIAETNAPAAWLQLDRSQGVLAVVRWEELLHSFFPVPILRIPNFVVDPVVPDPPLDVALCAAAGRRDAAAVAAVAEDVLVAIGQAVPEGARVHVFAAEPVLERARARFESMSSPADVIVHDPAAASALMAPDRSGRGAGCGLANVWLLWMAQELESKPVDLVHVLAPGRKGATDAMLAIGSPLDVRATAPDQFAPCTYEVATFLNIVGASAVILGWPGDPRWTGGLRILADQLAWHRPGSVLVHEPAPGGVDELRACYAFLSGADDTPPRLARGALWCHPRRLPAYAGGPELQIPEEELRAEARSFGSGIGQRIAWQGARRARGVTAPAAAWQQFARREVDQAVLETSDRGRGTRAGAENAFEFLTTLIEE